MITFALRYLICIALSHLRCVYYNNCICVISLARVAFIITFALRYLICVAFVGCLVFSVNGYSTHRFVCQRSSKHPSGRAFQYTHRTTKVFACWTIEPSVVKPLLRHVVLSRVMACVVCTCWPYAHARNMYIYIIITTDIVVL